jgi:hypothetical protein
MTCTTTATARRGHDGDLRGGLTMGRRSWSRSSEQRAAARQQRAAAKLERRRGLDQAQDEPLPGPPSAAPARSKRS